MELTTTWLLGKELPLPPKVAKALNEKVLKTVERIVASRLPRVFGMDQANDLVADQMVRFLERIGDRERNLPDFVVDSKTLGVWMTREILSRVSKAMKARKVQGYSSLSPEATDQTSDTDEPQIAAAMDQSGMELGETLDLAMEDFKRLKGANWARICNDALQGRTQREVAQLNGVGESELSRQMNAFRFCIARRAGFSPEELAEAFGESNTQEWLAVLETQ